MQWVRVRDKFPPEDKKVLGLWAQGTNGAEIITVSWNPQNGWYNESLTIEQIYVITYWHPLIEVPTNWWE